MFKYIKIVFYVNGDNSLWWSDIYEYDVLKLTYPNI